MRAGFLVLASSCLASAFVPAVQQKGLLTSSQSVRSQPFALSTPLFSTAEEATEPAVTDAEPAETDSLKGWTLVWEDINTLPPEEHSQLPLILRSTTDKSYLKDRFFVLIRHKGGARLVDSSCGRCSFPLINAPIVDEPALAEEDNAAIACKVCGMRHSITTGKACKPSGSALGPGQAVGNFFLKRNEYKNIESHPVRVTPDGKVYAKLSPRKEKRPTTDMIVL